jgi:hypothetical protein
LNCWKIIAQQARAPERQDVDVVDDDPAGGGVRQAVDHAQERGLAGARAPDHADHLRPVEGCGEAAHRGRPPERLLQPRDLDEHRALPVRTAPP